MRPLRKGYSESSLCCAFSKATQVQVTVVLCLVPDIRGKVFSYVEYNAYCGLVVYSFWLSGKRICLQCRRCTGNWGLIPGSGRTPREGNGNPLQNTTQQLNNETKNILRYVPSITNLQRVYHHEFVLCQMLSLHLLRGSLLSFILLM